MEGLDWGLIKLRKVLLHITKKSSQGSFVSSVAYSIISFSQNCSAEKTIKLEAANKSQKFPHFFDLFRRISKKMDR